MHVTSESDTVIVQLAGLLTSIVPAFSITTVISALDESDIFVHLEGAKQVGFYCAIICVLKIIHKKT